MRVDTAVDEVSTAMASLSTAGGGAAAAAPSTAAATWAPGTHVTLSPSYTQHGDAASGPLKPSEVATVVATEAEGCIILVRTAGGRQVILLIAFFDCYVTGLLSCSGGSTGPLYQPKPRPSPSKRVRRHTSWNLLYSQTLVIPATDAMIVLARDLAACAAIAAIMICVQAALVKLLLVTKRPREHTQCQRTSALQNGALVADSK